MTQTYDVVIAGGGTAGVILANRIKAQNPNASILVAEKESALGGRVRSIDSEHSHWNYGLNSISKKLYDFLNQTLKTQAFESDIEDYHASTKSRFGVLAANKVNSLEQEKMFDKKGARLVGGLAAARDWTVFDDLMADLEEAEKRKQSVGQLWKGKRKSPSAIVLEHLSRSVGIPNVWSTTGEALRSKRKSSKEEQYYFGRWADLYKSLLSHNEEADEPSHIDVKTNCEIADAIFHEYQNQWEIITSQGTFHSRALVVAQSPWDAIKWLPKKEWPVDVLNVVNKAKPVSVLSLTERLKVPTQELIDEIPEVIIVPAEDCQIIVANAHTEIVFQATLDFELSVQAPDVVKAVKRLKRARKKFKKAFPDCELSGDHLALQPIGWAQPLSASGRKLIKKIAKGSINSNRLLFCGDAYGKNIEGDTNLIQSVLDACETLSAGLTERATECQPT